MNNMLFIRDGKLCIIDVGNQYRERISIVIIACLCHTCSVASFTVRGVNRLNKSRQEYAAQRREHWDSLALKAGNEATWG